MTVGSLWEDGDRRAGNRVVRIISVNLLLGLARYKVVTSEFLPWTVGRRRWIRMKTLRRNYDRISH